MAKGAKGGGDTTTQKLEPADRQYLERIRGAAGAAAGQPLTQFGGQTVADANGLSVDAATQLQRNGGLFDLGVDALSGNADAMGKFYNPFETGVVDAASRDAQRLATEARMGIGDQATLSGAFGGSRHGVAEGQATGDIYNSAADRVAQLRYQGFSDAQTRALQAANLGMGINQQQFNAGDYFRNIQQDYNTSEKDRFDEARGWDVRNLGILQSGMTGLPYGQSTTTPGGSNPLMAGAGGALAGWQVGGPAGAIIGGGLGLFGG